MSIVMPAMHLSHFDPFNSSYNTNYFDSQEHYLQPAVAYSSPHQFPVDPRWFNSSFSGHASAAPHYFSSMTHSDIISPPSPTDLLSLSPSSTIAPIPPLSRSRNRQSSMSNANPNSATNTRIRSFTRPGTRYQRQHSTTSSHVSTTTPITTTSDNNNANASTTTDNTPSITTTQRIARRSTVSSSSPSSSRLLASPNHPYSSYTQSPTLRHSPPLGLDSSRATKRRRTDDHDASHLQSFTTIPEPPQLLTTTQTPQHLALMHAHGYPPAQTWAGPPSASADHLPHGVSPDPHSYSQWPVLPLPYYPTDPASESQLHDVSLPSSDVSQTQMLPYPSPTVVGPTFFSSALSPEHLETPHSSQFPGPKYESVSPRLVHRLLDEEEGETIEHGPTEFPPRPYQDNKSPWAPTKVPGKIYGSRLEQMPAIETRMARLENQIDQYLDVRAAQSLKNSQLPGLDFDQPTIECKPLGPCRMYGGHIWPTALARRVRRTPRD